jgi:hypothetical protein
LAAAVLFFAFLFSRLSVLILVFIKWGI